jgi:iron(III) transport system permease protein
MCGTEDSTSMRALRPLGRLTRWVIAALATVPLAALVLAAVVDRGPRGALRLSLFPLALTLLDDYVWECARNSIAVAALAAAVSLGLGLGLALILGRWRFWGRGVWKALAFGPLVVPPLFGAIGLRHLFWATDSATGWPRSWAIGHWLALVALDVFAGAPLVALSVCRALSCVDPVWEEAARGAGAGPGRIWGTLIWPLVRPAAAGATAAVFTCAMFEPGGPLVLGIRRTLAFQIVEAALSDDAPTHAAILALLGCGVAGLARAVASWWSKGGLPNHVSAARPPARRADWRRAAAYAGCLGVWTGLAWVPLSGLLAIALPQPVASSEGVAGSHWERLRLVIETPETRNLVLCSLGVGFIVATLTVAAAPLLAPARRRRGAGPSRLVPIPALAVAVGILAVPWILRVGADAMRSRATSAVLPSLVIALEHGIDPYRAPGVALVWALTLVRLPLSVSVAGRARRRCRPVLRDAALSLGGAQARVWSTITRPLVGGPLVRAWLLTAALAATSVGPALLLLPLAASWTIGPGVLFLADSPGGASQAAAMALIVACSANLAALAWAMRGSAAPVWPGDVFLD